MQNKILNHQEIQHKIKRIAYQIYEANVEENEIVIAGIDGGGLLFAKKIGEILQEITKAKITLCTVSMEKSNQVYSGVSTSIPEHGYRNKSFLLVDEVR